MPMRPEKDRPSRRLERIERRRTACPAVDTSLDIITTILQGALLDAQCPDDKIRSVAEGKLKELQDKNLPNFLQSLAAELSSDASPLECKRLAGSILKDLLDEMCSANRDQWIKLDQLIKFKIKESLLVALGSLVPDARHASSQVIAKVAYIEIPRREWPDLIGKLLANMAQQDASSPLKEGTLEALGCVTEEILGLDPDEVNDVLNALIPAMNKSELSSEVRLAAVKALQNILKHANFADEDCRNGISSEDCRFIEKPLSALVPLLLETLLNQEGDDDAQNIAMSGTACLGFIARTIGDAIVPLVMQFVEGNIKASDWQSRKAATSALGVILEGPSIENLAPVVGLLIDRMEDPNLEVRVTTACTLGRAFELLHSPALGNRVLTNKDLRRTISVLAKSARDVPEVSEKACRAIYFLARGYEDAGPISSELSPFISTVFDVLFSASELDKETPFRVRASASAYEALSEVVRVINMQDYPSVAIRVLMPRIMRRLNMLLNIEAISASDKRNKSYLQVLLCSVLHVIIEKLSSDPRAAKTVTKSARFLLLLFCRVLASSGARDKAAVAIGALAHAVGPKFVDHMPILLQYHNVKHLSPVYLGVIVDIFRLLGDEILPYCDDMMEVLYGGLSSMTVKPAILACFGEIAVAIGQNFKKYLQTVMKRLKDAADFLEEYEVNYSNQLRQGIFKAYSGILRAMKDPVSGLKVAAGLFEFTQAVCKDQSRARSVSDTVVDVLGDFRSMAESWTKEQLQEVTKCSFEK